MIELSDSQRAQYFQRSYTSVDGLWFMKVEEKYDFDTALDLDRNVWKVLPKIQARTLIKLGNLGRGLETLREALETKLDLEGYKFSIEKGNGKREFTIYVTECPWVNLMKSSQRKHLAEKVGETICTEEYPVWASEFGEHIDFSLEGMLCGGAQCCIMKFVETI